MKISLARNPLIALLIRRASRATFPDMGRLLLSELPSTDGEKAITFSKSTFSVNQHIPKATYSVRRYIQQGSIAA